MITLKKQKILVTAVAALLFLTFSAASTASAAMLGERTLRIGSAGEDVKLLQDALIKEGYYGGAADGSFGGQTQQAVIEFQRAKNLKGDGIAGSRTFTALGASIAKTSSEAAPSQYKKVLNAVATAYAPGPHDNGKWGNLTHIGTTVRPGIIAVDPKVIPLGSRVYVEYADGHGAYVTAEDTGGAIKGNRIDIAMWTVTEAYKFGMQDVKVYILE